VPLSKTQGQSDYSPISSLKQQAEKEDLNVYSFNTISPEIIWQFGDKIPSIKINDSTYNFPKENTFGLLANDLSPEDESLLKNNYIMEQHDTYDLNRNEPNKRGHKKRLVSNYYILTKK
jgi:hypothetical protein